MAHPLGNQHVAESLQLRDHRPRDAGHHIIRQRRFAHDHPHGVQRPVITAGIAPDVVVLAFEAVEAHRHRPQAGIQQPSEPFGSQGHAIGHHAPRITAARDLGARLLQVRTHQHLTARKDDEHIGRVYVGRDLLVENFQEIGQWHVSHTGVHTAIAAAMTAREVAAQRTLPEKRIETVFTHRRSIQIGKDIEGQPFAKPQPTTGHSLLPGRR